MKLLETRTPCRLLRLSDAGLEYNSLPLVNAHCIRHSAKAIRLLSRAIREASQVRVALFSEY